MSRLRAALAAEPALAAAAATGLAALIAWEVSGRFAGAVAATSLIAAAAALAAVRAATTPNVDVERGWAAAWADGAAHALPVRPPTWADTVVIDGTRRIVSVRPTPQRPRFDDPA